MHSRTVLLIEQDDRARALHRMALESAGYRVVEGRTGDQVLRLVHEESPCVLVMQCSLPGVSGLRATEVLKEEPETRGIPVLLVGSAAEEEGRARSAGCDAYLGVQDRPGRLLEAVQSLRRVAGSSERPERAPPPRTRAERLAAERAWADERMGRTWDGLRPR